MDYIITTEHLTKKYKNFTSVNHVSLHIRKGSIYGFLGPNGAGKSTTMKMLLGLTAPTKGSFTIDGKQFPISICENRKSKRQSAICSIPACRFRKSQSGCPIRMKIIFTAALKRRPD